MKIMTMATIFALWMIQWAAAVHTQVVSAVQYLTIWKSTHLRKKNGMDYDNTVSM